VQGLDAQVAALHGIALTERAVCAAREAGRLEGVRQHGRIGVARAHRLEVRDMVAVVVGDQDVRDAEAMAIDGCDDGLRRAAGVDEDGVATWVVADDIRVGEPPGLHAAFEDHAASVATRDNRRVFDEPARVSEDLKLLERLRGALRAAPRRNGEQRFRRGAEHHRVAVPDWEALERTRPAAGVGFFGQARAEVDHEPIVLLEDEIVARASTVGGLLAYHNALLEPGRWANLVVFAAAEAIGGLRGDVMHEAAVALTPVHYASLRLHRGELVEGALGAAPFRLERTLFLDFSEDPPKRFVRT
jgi:hypothetical protein